MQSEKRKEKPSDDLTIGHKAGGKESVKDAKHEKHALARALKHPDKGRKKADNSPGDVEIESDD
jgi:hypothetical protein